MPLIGDQTQILTIVVRAQDQTAAALRGVSAEVGGMQAAVAAAGRTMLIAGVAAGAALGLALKETVGPAMQFDAVMSGVGAVTGATAQEMAALRAEALLLGKQTVFSANEAGTAIEELAKAGISTTDILNGAAAATVNLAAAGQVDLPQAAIIASNAMNMFSLSGQQAAHVSDMIAGAANASSLDVSAFGESLQYVGGIASSLKMPFDDVAVAIAELGKFGITGSRAGTGLTDMLARLQPRGGAATKTMQELGLITKQGGNAFFDAAGHIKRLADIQQILQDATRGLTDAQKAHDIQLIFGLQGQTTANKLLQEGAAGFNAMAAQMSKVTAQGVASARLNNLAGDLTNLSGSLETLRINLGEAFGGGTGMPAFRALAQSINSIVQAMIDWTTAHGPLLSRILPLVATIGGITAAALTLGGAFALLAVAVNPVTLAVGGLLAAGAALGVAWSQDWGGIRETVDAALSAIQPAIETLRYIIGTLIDDVRRGDWGAAWQDALAMGQAAIGRFTDWLGTTALPAIRAHLGAWSAAFGAWATALWSTAVQPALAGVGTQFVAWMNSTAAAIRTHTQQWATAFAAWLVPAQTASTKGLTAWVTSLQQWVNSDGTQAMVGLANALGDAFVAAIIAVIKNSAGAFGQAVLYAINPAHAGEQFSLLGTIASPLKGLFQGGLETPGGQASAVGTTADAARQAAARALGIRQAAAQALPATVPPPVTTRTVPNVPNAAADAWNKWTAQATTATQATRAHQRATEDSTTALRAMYVRLGLPDIAPPVRGGAGGYLAGGEGERIAQHYADQRAALERSLQFGSADHQRAAAALASAASAGAGTGAGGTATTPAAASLLAQGPSTQVNITVQVGSGAVQVQQGGKADAGTRDYGLKVGEAIADALARFARAEQAVPLPPRHAVAGARG